MKTIVFFLEEPSAKEMLAGLLPRILPENILIRFIVFRGKQDLEKNLKKKLNGWRLPNSVSRNIAPFLSLESNRSKSFNVLLSGIRKLAEG